MSAAGQTAERFGQAALAYLDGLYGYAMSLCHNQAEAEDLTQETYLRAVKAFGQFAPDSNLKNWLFAILRNIWLNEIRHTHSGPQFVGMDEEAEQAGQVKSSEDPHAVYVSKVEQAGVRAAVESLPPLYREVILLREFEDLSYQEIAAILNCPAGTVMSRLGRARERLRAILSSWRSIAEPSLEADQP
ncbi:MAG TPA: sigma-70 family RNA polymerase sigma factor [Bryobacteraceae bacterium]|nr:sigma-70 family RNA polymerase sigma factor [Bryobacteraceae bacterium]